jgi:hypothetical protein
MPGAASGFEWPLWGSHFDGPNFRLWPNSA